MLIIEIRVSISSLIFKSYLEALRDSIKPTHTIAIFFGQGAETEKITSIFITWRFGVCLECEVQICLFPGQTS